MMLGLVGVALTAAAVSGGFEDTGLLFGTLATAGAAMFGIGALRLPGWARLRRRQMEEIAARVSIVASAKPMPDLDSESRD